MQAHQARSVKDLRQQGFLHTLYHIHAVYSSILYILKYFLQNPLTSGKIDGIIDVPLSEAFFT